MAAVTLVLAGCSSLGAASQPRASAAPTAPLGPAATPAATAPGGPALLDIQGSGSQSSSSFQAPSSWTVRYTFDCRALKAPGRFQLDVRTSDAQQDPLALAVAETGAGTVPVHDSGSVRFEIATTCAWHVTAIG